jgi:crotonobetainyl-CoA:carnitine CoA-transferase CaiB-like acyl-CoA transferase
MWDPASTVGELTSDPQALANDCFVPFEHPTKGPIKIIANPIKLSKAPATIRRHAPECGENTEEILLEMGYNWEDIARLKQEKIIP